MPKIKAILALTSVICFVGCPQNTSPNETLAEANRIHVQTTKLHQITEQKLKAIKGKAIAEDDVRLSASADSLINLVELWELGILEVPGFEHSHAHKAGTHHEHKIAPQMTDESMLEYQKIARAAIGEIAGEVDKLSVTTKARSL